MIKLVFQLLLAMLPGAAFSQNAFQADAAKEKELQATIVELLAKANNNFEGMSGAEVVKEKTFVMYIATEQPKMYAQNYYITAATSNKRNYYMSYYTTPAAIQFAKAAITDLLKSGGDKWKIEPTKTNDSSIIISFLYYNGAKVAQLREDLNGKNFAISVGVFDNSAATSTSTTPTQQANPNNAEGTRTKQVQAALADLVAKAPTNFESMKGPEEDHSLYSTMYKTTAGTNLYAQASYINYCKANGKSYFMAYYLMPAEEFNVIISAFANMPQYGGNRWKFEQVKKEDKYDDESYFVNLGYLYYDGVKVAEFRKNEYEDISAANFYLLSIGLFDKPDGNRPGYEAITHPVESYRPSPNLTVSNNIISVKNRGVKFDGEYDVARLAKDSCVSGNCTDGQGRKVLASISNNIPRIRIMEGRFKNNVFLGDGDMLIDGESPVVDGTYELGKFKVNYNHNTLQSSAIFHPRDYDEIIEGDFSGYLDDGIGKAMPGYQKFVVCKFHPAYDAKKKVVSKWYEEIYSRDRDLSFNIFWLSKENSEAYDKIKAAENKPDYSNTGSINRTQKTASRTEKLTIRRTCGACGGTGKIYHNVTEYSYSGGSRIATSRRVSETCGVCHGSGYLQ